MKSLIIVLCIALTLLADKPLVVVASVPDLADMARAIGGDAVEVFTLATGREDLHAVPARPSFLPRLNKAQLLLTLGLDAEHAWLPALAAEARNPTIREDGPGWIECSAGISVRGKPQILDRSEGEQHPQGNPHYTIGPHCGVLMATTIEQAFVKALPLKASAITLRSRAYRASLDSLSAELTLLGASLKGTAIIEYHPDLAYLCEFYGLRTIGSIEPKAGVAPTARHLKNLEQSAREKGVKLIVYNQSQNPKIPQALAARLGCRAVQIANAVGAQPQITSWAALQRYNVHQLLAGLGETGR
jgi:zinc/manganese transport system substrate-binding protein